MGKIDFDKLNGLVPCVVQDAATQKVLMVAFMNIEAYEKTVREKKVTFYSRSKKRLWTKGETSGNSLELVEILQDCDNDSLLVKVNPKGPTCHTGSDTCFNEKNEGWNLSRLEALIKDRKTNPKKGSYTTSLFEAGINKIAQKVGEEAVELVIEAKDDNKELFLNEAADLLYHYLVLLHEKNMSLDDVKAVLKKRHK
ncbi:MAG TPA: bifunctional phosphoribosyl-AMP cyclohydrolase/phosphoribosyl-ATP diphosphatase HisIE [Cyclobacteriaceae bacterium]|nr:bifunctional phosphoribosyl-AMP cyclohydrolase/phosphoribosyl-ATP diphosphatase HisIE [Cyclobacteriaceae bacterium]HMV09938.1 bifunctional phosphoribosyl-AMP cyclohydrolase/phosphoribosyl-ATP diphosphatase HisIE [Cyclobacteriaceae bacterium]HMV90693.1 bifunctional phosphoribosyl-AMP cyclohydrolase/phosphoribosyl-ATP diphosphatase HisIE [Cyclobacteriaceae bacterium]HMX01623.1 bifunctional phosphoribosyl-AMP cyclohydrolase/phosphoribosyl-ATP diphosphatase HisIE [Cyclobacteriaceae bacterium]HMX